MATEDKFWNVEHENYDWSTETMSRVPADGTIWWYDDNGYIFSIVGNGTDDVETLRADQIEAYTQAVTKAGCQCDIDGEGTPPIPDNPDGVIYSEDNFTELDIWSVLRSTATFTDGNMVLESTGLIPGIGCVPATNGFTSKSFVIKITKISSTALTYAFYDGITYSAYDWGNKTVVYLSGYCVSTATNFNVYPGYTGDTIGDEFKIETIYIGDGTYTTGVADHSGTHNPATNTAVTPVDSKWGKLGHYNGETSNLEFDNPIIGTTGTIRIHLKNVDYSDTAFLFSNHGSVGGDGGIVCTVTGTTGVLSISIYNSIGTPQTFTFSGKTPDNTDTLYIVVTSTVITLYAGADFISSTLLTITPSEGPVELAIGCRATSDISQYRLNGDLSLNYTAEIFDADQVKSDYDNPRKFSNEPVSQTPTAYTMSQHDGNGHTLMEFATKTATSEGNQGAIAFDATNVYFCIADSSWMKIPLESI